MRTKKLSFVIAMLAMMTAPVFAQEVAPAPDPALRPVTAEPHKQQPPVGRQPIDKRTVAPPPIHKMGTVTPIFTDGSKNGLNFTLIELLARQKQSVPIEKSHILSAQGNAKTPIGAAPGAVRAGGMVPTGPGVNPRAIAQPVNSGLHAICTSPSIYTVDGQQSKPALQPAGPQDTNPTDSTHTITGCMFGDSQTNAKVYLYPFTNQAGGQVQLSIDTWTDTGIVVQLDPRISGELDHAVSLIVVRSDGKEAKLNNVQFVAARASTWLPNFPKSEVYLAPAGGGAVGNTFTFPIPVNPTFTSPYAGLNREEKMRGQSVSGPGAGAGMTAGVDRDSSKTSFGPGTDTWNTKNLQPGFVPTAYQVGEWNVEVCQAPGGLFGGGDVFGGSQGTWKDVWQGTTLQIYWQEQDCSGANNDANSSYAISIAVTGPRCIDPWTGQANKSCMQGQ
jgi:hypothetical protein